VGYRNKVQLYQCEICGEEGPKGLFDVHHIDENHSNNAEYNLVTLCPNHHRLAHLKKIVNLRWAMSTNGRVLLYETV